MGKEVVKAEEDHYKFFLLVYLDVQGLYDRISTRKYDYVKALTMKRNREPLKEVFKTKYFTFSADILQEYPVSVIKKLDEFYRLADDLYWYLDNTEDMTQAIKDKVDAYMIHFDKLFTPLMESLEQFNSIHGDFPELSESREEVSPVIKLDIEESPDIGKELNSIEGKLNDIEEELSNIEPTTESVSEVAAESEEINPPILPTLPE